MTLPQPQDPQAPITLLPETIPGLEAARKQVERILASDTLRAADTLRKLLRFLADKTFSGEADNLKEYAVGLDGVGKPSSYDPRQDSGVRIQASRLRQKLDEYYHGEGNNDPLTIELPKGGFKIVWKARNQEIPAVAIPPGPGVAPLVTPAESLSEGMAARRWRLLAMGLAISSVIFASLSGWLIIANAKASVRRVIPGSSPELDALWGPLISSAHHLTIAYADPFFVRFQPKDGADIVFHRKSVLKWDDAVKSPEFALLSKWLGNPPAKPSLEYAMRSDLVSTFVLAQFLATRRGDVSVTSVGELSWQQFADNDVIMLASRSKTDERQSASPVKPAFLFEKEGVRNLRPLAGEPAVYASPQDPQDGTGDTLELISVMPGPLGRTKIMSFTCNRTWACIGAVQSLTDNAFVRVAAQKMRAPSGEMPPFYQLVVRISYRGGTPVNSSYVTHRALTVERNAAEASPAPG